MYVHFFLCCSDEGEDDHEEDDDINQSKAELLRMKARSMNISTSRSHYEGSILSPSYNQSDYGETMETKS